MEPFATIELETIAKEAEVPVLILPGLFGSGPEHWQGHWERENPHFKRIQQRNWYHPVLAEWIYAIDLSATNAAQPPVMVAHSLGCIALAHWAERCAGRVAGAMLVAPPDIDRGACLTICRDSGQFRRPACPSRVLWFRAAMIHGARLDGREPLLRVGEPGL